MGIDVKSSCRDKNELNVLVKTMLNIALNKAKKNNVVPLVTETYRPLLRQYYLYGQGRNIQQCINAGMPSKYANAYARGGNKVTWTLNSIHIQRCAVDVIPQRKGKAIWNSKDPDTIELIKCMESVGFEAGANWHSSPDSPHFQVKGIKKGSKVFSQHNNTTYVTRVLQKKLKKLGFYDGTIDGDWGKLMNRAVKTWKRSKGWKVNSNIGTTALEELLG